MIQTILNIGAGKMQPINYISTGNCSGTTGDVVLKYKLGGYFQVNVDSMFLNTTSVADIIKKHEEITKLPHLNDFSELNTNFDIYVFLERYQYTFDNIVLYRFLEHVPKVKILYFIYLLSTTVKIGGTIDVIVPDYEILAKRILNEVVDGSSDFEHDDIITTFELLNEPNCPHASIWTLARAIHFFKLEGRFMVEHWEQNYYFDGRNCYLRFLAKRIK